MEQPTKYEVIAEQKAKLRLYINDPAILKQLDHPLKLMYPIPIEIEGKMVIGKTKDGKLHWFFAHKDPDFIPVFADLELGEFKKIAVSRS